MLLHKKLIELSIFALIATVLVASAMVALPMLLVALPALLAVTLIVATAEDIIAFGTPRKI